LPVTLCLWDVLGEIWLGQKVAAVTLICEGLVLVESGVCLVDIRSRSSIEPCPSSEIQASQQNTFQVPLALDAGKHIMVIEG